MARSERRLIDPDDDALGAALHDAVARTGAPAFGLDEERRQRSWRRALSAHPEGRLLDDLLALRQVGATWWTDAVGRKHVLVQGDDRGEIVPLGDPRPPLALLHPERLFARRVGGVTAWLAACACGAVGTPGSLGWVGDCCGPCHDRREDRAAPPPQRPTRWHCPGGYGWCVLFTPDGASVAASAGGSVWAWPAAGGAGRELFGGGPGTQIKGLAFADDGTAALYNAGACRVLVSDDDGWEEVPCGGYEAPPLAFDGDRALFVGGTTTIVWHRSPTGWREAGQLAVGVNAVAVGLPGAALGGEGWVAFYDRAGPQQERRVKLLGTDDAVDFLAWLPGGVSVLAVTLPTNFTLPQRRAFLVSAEGATRAVRPVGLLPISTSLALSPDGCFLAGPAFGSPFSSAEVVFWEVPSCREVARLGAEPDWVISDLAISPDGETLATISRSGVVQLWPWRRLLEA
jgi:hypothetical protein